MVRWAASPRASELETSLATQAKSDRLKANDPAVGMNACHKLCAELLTRQVIWYFLPLYEFHTQCGALCLAHIQHAVLTTTQKAAFLLLLLALLGVTPHSEC